MPTRPDDVGLVGTLPVDETTALFGIQLPRQAWPLQPPRVIPGVELDQSPQLPALHDLAHLSNGLCEDLGVALDVPDLIPFDCPRATLKTT